jgi:AraC-like DNA-binding protein
MKSRWALAVYNFALRISKESGVFFCSAVGLAEHFGCNERSIRRAFEQLLEVGFFELTGQARFEANVYTVIPHRVWAERNPGQCVTRLAFPWSGECDQLGQKLWVASGGRAKFRPYQIKFLKTLRLSDERIVSEFAAFWLRQSRNMRADQFKSNRRLLIGQFIDLMKENAGRSRVVV